MDHIQILYYCIKCGDPSKYGTEETGRIHCYNCKLPHEKALTKYTLCYSCDTRATYGIEEDKPLFCSKHKPEGYSLVTRKLCICGKTLGFGKNGVLLSCATCKGYGHSLMRNNPRCKCGNIRLYGPEDGGRTTCKKCKKSDHVLIALNACLVCKQRRATWGLENEPLTRCRKCKLPNYVSKYPKRSKCEVCKRKVARYGLPGETRSRCGGCKESHHT